MFAQTHLALQGRFKFDVFNSSGELRYSKGPINNFITSTGLCFPSLFAFADCFRYISLGSGTGANSIETSVNNGWGTTGLQSGLSDFAYIGSHQCDTTNAYSTDSCGYTETSNGVKLTRGWRIPSGDGTFTSDYNFQEFMVSPGRPPTVDPVDSSTACACYEYTTYSFLPGPDGSDIAYWHYYNNLYITPDISMCDYTQAFARIVSETAVNEGDFLVVSYELTITTETGIQAINLSIENTAGTPTTNWSGTLKGTSSLVHHGLQMIRDGSETTTQPQLGYPYTSNNSQYGESFIPEWGAPMEPSCPIENVKAYLSTDNIRFMVNHQTGSEWTSNQPIPVEGEHVMGWRWGVNNDYINTSFVDVRRSGVYLIDYADPTDYTTTTSLLSLGYDLSYIDSNVSIHKPLDSYVKHHRTRTGKYSFEFWSENHEDFWGKPVRSLVIAYYNSSYAYYIPFFDVVFKNTGDFWPTINHGAKTYKVETDTNPATGYFYIENGSRLTMTFNQIWSSPCHESVLGCP